MLTTAPHLHIRRPSPTTVEFTVTTRPPATVPLRLLLLAVGVGRAVLAAGALLLLLGKWAGAGDAWALRAPCEAPEAARRLAAAAPAWLLLPACAAALLLSVVRAHASESLLVLRGLGVQTAARGGTLLSRGETRFIPTEKIRDVLINEAFRGFEVRYYLAVVVEGEEDVVVVFPGLLPGREIVETVWRGVRRCLYEPDAGIRRVDEKG